MNIFRDLLRPRSRRHRPPQPELESSTEPIPSSVTDTTSSMEPARYYVHYDIDNPPAHPGNGWTRFVCISDTHSRRFNVPPGDVLLHSGDLSSWGELPQLRKTIDWLKGLPHPAKVIIAGNHDVCLRSFLALNHASAHRLLSALLGQRLDSRRPPRDTLAAQDLMRCQETRDAGIVYIEHEAAQIVTSNGREWAFYGSPATPRYALGAFQYSGMLSSVEGVDIYARIPPNTEILLTHTPALGICDITKRGKHAGCHALRDRLESPDLSNCRLHVFGHIHEAQGVEVHPVGDGTDTLKVRVSVNAAMHDYNPIIVDLLD
ncbi:Metallo-dependent phosphatase [Cristinia sonorae]|uniref:Metallo-dependent phosphatase n=1 Tax=Cristinia sonorae TaxID=1940300 RepID=A0A8K0UXE1_9AGAR|nr:Metallo-dependent phosphatase [Cristinia sonorae]